MDAFKKDTEADRTDFEAWAIQDDPKVASQLARDEDGYYVRAVIGACWDAWQASVARAETALPVAWMNEDGDIQKERASGYDWPLYAGDAQP